MSETRLSPAFWESDKEAICRVILEKHHPLRIILKTRNESLFLKRWVDHHCQIVPKTAITIFDNNSDDPECLDYYSEIQEEIQIVNFSGLHNDIHDTIKFSALYTALRQACDYYLFIDTDEFLYLYENGALRKDESIPNNLRSNIPLIYPTVRLDNAPGTDEIFTLTPLSIEAGIRWGKPIIHSEIDTNSYINQNIQVNEELYPKHVDTRFVTIHLSKLDSQQRINANLNKLGKRGFFKTDDWLSEAKSTSIEHVRGRQVKNYLEEIQRLSSEPFEDSALEKSDGDLREGEIFVDMESGKIDFPDTKTKILADTHLAARRDVKHLLRKSKMEEKKERQTSQAGKIVQGLSIKPHMTPREIDILTKWIKPAKFVLEFGSGGSTVLAGALQVPRVVSVDSSTEWLDKLRQAPELQKIDFAPRHVDIGPLKSWGHPADRATAWRWPAYYRRVWGQIDGQTPDVVFVDGRFRVACVLITLLKCNEDTIIIVHDFWKRSIYKDILEFVDTLERADQIGVFKRKKNIDWRALALILSRFALEPE